MEYCFKFKNSKVGNFLRYTFQKEEELCKGSATGSANNEFSRDF